MGVVDVGMGVVGVGMGVVGVGMVIARQRAAWACGAMREPQRLDVDVARTWYLYSSCRAC